MPKSRHALSGTHNTGRACPGKIRLRTAGVLLITSISLGTLSGQTTAAALETTFNQGADAYNKGDYARSITLFEQVLKQAKPSPALESIYFTIAQARLLMGDHNGAIEAFRTYLRLYPNGAQLNDARAGLTKAFIATKRMPEALAAIDSLRNLRERSGSQGIDNYASVLDLTLSITDSLLADKKPAQALELVQAALFRDEIIEAQRRRIGQLERLYKLTLATSAGTGADSVIGANRDALATRVKNAQDALKFIEEKTDFDIPRLLRQAQCYMELDRPWEATVVYNEILSQFPESPDRAYALRGLIFARQMVNKLAEAQSLCQRFIDQFPTSPLAPEIAAIGGQISSQLQDDKNAEAFFGVAVTGSQGDMLERVIFQLGGTRFSLSDWAGARAMFDRYVRDYPKGQWADNAAYRSAITWFLDIADVERYTKAEKSIQAFIDTHPSSEYLADAYYRLAVCKFAYQEYKAALTACAEWQKRFPENSLLPEVLSLQGDVQKTMGDTDAATESYLGATAASSSDDVISYALNEVGRLLEQKRDWARLDSVFSGQIERQPDSKLALGWYYWVARAKARAGQIDESWNFLADHVGVQLDNPANEDVEKIIELMAQIRSRQRTPEGAPPAPLPSVQLGERLHIADDASPLIKARVLYYQARVFGFTRKQAQADASILSIGTQTPPESLSAPLLAVSGEALFKSGNTERAELFFNALLERFPNSDYRDFAYVGQGDLALTKNDAQAALAHYTDAIKKTGAPHRQREATVGQARSQFALGNFAEATKLFELIAGAKEWRGEATALSLFYLGEIAVKQGDLPKGIIFYQRVFVSHVRYPEWVAKSYLASGQAFESLGKKPEAAKTYHEMLRNERLADQPQTAVARTRLKALDPSSS
ncbi:tetratricopeptide repeat protein [Rariglobus hedericola]|uniref:Tetratricopeptide repeat protein n=1 Tax=Rariglobus hedericola TaxID=2597822 RepID=A0A556QKX5_9BACT|nr:tetratricopeptide repeat protein [Rariglobus hedericola]TSJ77305.1 tetratricopeptide repeat protein [Rariglobus hedericola]